VLLRVVPVVVDPHADGGVRSLRRPEYHDAPGTGNEVSAGQCTAGEHARGFHDDVDTQLAPRRHRGVLRREELQGEVSDLDVVIDEFDLLVESPLHRVVLEEVRHRRVAG
jgi:hypothetical protein